MGNGIELAMFSFFDNTNAQTPYKYDTDTVSISLSFTTTIPLFRLLWLIIGTTSTNITFVSISIVTTAVTTKTNCY